MSSKVRRTYPNNIGVLEIIRQFKVPDKCTSNSWTLKNEKVTLFDHLERCLHNPQEQGWDLPAIHSIPNLGRLGQHSLPDLEHLLENISIVNMFKTPFVILPPLALQAFECSRKQAILRCNAVLVILFICSYSGICFDYTAPPMRYSSRNLFVRNQTFHTWRTNTYDREYYL